MMVLPKLNNKGLQLSRLERTPDKREVGGSSPLKPIHIFLNENEQSEVRIQKNSTPHRAKRDDGVTKLFLSEDERKRSLRLENKHTLRSNGVTTRDFTSVIPLERMKDVEVRIFKSHC